MTKSQREAVRGALIDLGFRKMNDRDLPKHYDRAHDGVYTEEWMIENPDDRYDRTMVTIDWDRKNNEKGER